MKKHLIAAAVAAAVAVPAAAQTVTIYGIMDIGHSSLDRRVSNGLTGRDMTTTGAGDGGLATSQIGFRGSEDLGGGLKAGFNLEYDLTDAANGGALGATRRSFLTLENSMGQLKLGQDTSAIHGVIAGFSAGFANNTVGALYTATASFGTGGVGGADATNTDGVRPHAAFTPGMISYTSPVINNFRARADYSKHTDETAGAITAETKEFGLSLTYTNGPLSLGAGWQDRTQRAAAPGTGVGADGQPNPDGTNTAAALNAFFGIAGNLNAATAASVGGADAAYRFDKDVLAIGGSYNFGVAQPFVLYTKADMSAGIGANAAVNEVAQADVVEFGVRVPMGATTYFGSMYSGEVDFSPVAGVNQGSSDTDGWQVGALYAMSKRTTAYAIYGTSETANDATRPAVGGNPSVQSDTKMYTIGVRHTF